ncbi:SGNH/GDSL hydrolase family protein [Candidatus Omnitrophota bacterium]
MLKKIKSIFFFVIWNCAVVFIVLELFLRFFLPGPMFHKITTSHHDDMEGYSLSQNRTLLYEPKPNTGQFNQDGYRGPLYPLKKQAGKTRIVVLGDSVAEGLNIDVGQRFTEILQGYLGDRYEVINLAVHGYNLRQELEYLRVKALQYAPDYIIVSVTNNDLVSWSSKTDQLLEKIKRLQGNRGLAFYKYYYFSLNTLDTFFLRLNTYRYIKYLQYSFKNKKSKKVFKVSEDKDFYYRIDEGEVDTIIQEMKMLAEDNDAHLSFVFTPFNEKYWRVNTIRIFKTAIKKNRLSYLDINHYVNLNFDALEKKNLLMENDAHHLLEKGHLLCAQFIYENFEHLTSQDIN